jgi:hypothetical protein
MKKGIFAMTLALTLGLAMINTGCGGAKTEGGDSTKKDTVAVAPAPAPVPADTMAHDSAASHEGHSH